MTAMNVETTMKDLKVRLPESYHMRLQTLKMIRGKSMSDALCEALDMYFAERKQEKETAGTLRAMLV